MNNETVCTKLKELGTKIIEVHAKPITKSKVLFRTLSLVPFREFVCYGRIMVLAQVMQLIFGKLVTINI